ncbi:unannotated protein [freshwater metagenome]|uniref:Unannotated protein n=1 Tax=freshwater metagenome TaxID=449393 RepID=A0A6J7QFU8_9ZZZZ|nr:transglycosylase SLT domain-containing protein [Actinomycetota bacterium]MSW15113.1 transglycosylase SLT domain-containing protein [Actinomycetota bacterium]MSW98712.1 transglycosylase SLT domain-containing protein [Actinomycetota bacterium]MSY82917.1 transglycosylase SLT domain-containing protein [Actinomycetota bacterium]MSZ45442.1 transglycosylase SLT domain-containing protein [Actinomycetota bacterium]
MEAISSKYSFEPSRTTPLRRPIVTLATALFFFFLGSVDTTYATGSFAHGINIPDLVNQENLTGQTLIDGQALPTTPGQSSSPSPAPSSLISIDLNGVASVDAKSIALVSVMAKNVELAKTPNGARIVAANLLNYFNWNKSQMACLDKLWTSESHWNFQAHNYRSGARGIPQALPPTKMDIISTDWRHNPVTQIKWGLSYIQSRYGTPCKAYAKKRARGYY